MKFDPENNKVLISVREFVSIGRRAKCVFYDETEDPAADGDSAVPLCYDFFVDDILFSVCGSFSSEDGGCLNFTYMTDSSPKHPKRGFAMQTKGEAYVCAYIYSAVSCKKAARINIKYKSADGEENTVSYSPRPAQLSEFFERLKISAAEYARYEADRISRRLPTLRSVRFPYRAVRDGQKELINAVYRAAAAGSRLYACAPTGIGKTVSVLFPAVRAIGEGKCVKAFYLTPKTTAAIAAMRCIDELCVSGACIKAVHVIARERICPYALECRAGTGCPCMNEIGGKDAGERMAEAVRELYDERDGAIGEADIRASAERHGVCPYELSLEYSEKCDVIICDFNYLFDMRVYFRRYFDFPGEYLFLVDEAHNLADRARDMYSVELSSSDFSVPELKYPFLHTARQKFEKLVGAEIGDMIRGDDENVEGASHGRRIPDTLREFAVSLLKMAEETYFSALKRMSSVPNDSDGAGNCDQEKEFYYKIKSFVDILRVYNDKYEYFVFRHGDEYIFKLYCIDPSETISSRLDRGRAAVFFSATLLPLNYYRDILGGDRSSPTLSLQSPFDRDRLMIAVMDKISTRLTDRDRTLSAVCRIVDAALSARRGNYMVFCPSFDYMELLYEYFRRRHPKIKTMIQRRGMSGSEREKFIAAFSAENRGYLVAFCVMGGIYSEGIDLAGDRLIGAIIIGSGIPQLSFEREAIAAYYDEKSDSGKQYAYIYPGMNRVLQAAGRVIRREEDRGIIVLADDRFADPVYREIIPPHWRGLKFVGNAESLKALLDRFWELSDDGDGMVR